MSARGWPFLIARGHRRGYAVLLAPGFLVDSNDYGFLEEVAAPVRDGSPPRVLVTTSPRGRKLCLVWREFPVTTSDRVPHTRDEHSRPLRLITGFVCPEGTVSSPSDADLATARAAALDTYRRFLDAEEHFAVEPSTPFPLESPVAQPSRAAEAPVAARVRPRFVIPIAAAAIVAAATTAVIAIAATTDQPTSPTCAAPTTLSGAPPLTTLAGPPLATTTLVCSPSPTPTVVPDKK